MKVAVIGGVRSTELLVSKLAAHSFDQVHVWGYSPLLPDRVSGWVDLSRVADVHGYGSSRFEKVADCEAELRDFGPDVLFAVGLSQIVPVRLLQLPPLGGVGFHPTALPRGRGRAAIAWMVRNVEDGAATFFGLREGVDDGPIYAQVGFSVTTTDDASSVEAKMLDAEAVALDNWLPRLRKGEWEAREQDHAQATWYGLRTPADGRVDWRMPSEEVLRLVRSSTRPHPGAFTQAGDQVLRIWRACADETPFEGVVGRILDVYPGGDFLVQTGRGLVRVTEWSADGDWHPRAGVRLGLDTEAEVTELRARCNELEARINALTVLLTSEGAANTRSSSRRAEP